MIRISLAKWSSLAALLIATTLPAQGFGQTSEIHVDAKHPRKLESIKCDRAEVRKLLDDLFQAEHRKYKLDPQIQGDVTLSLLKVNWQVALRLILRQVDAQYRISHGVFLMTPKPPAPTPELPTPKPLPLLTTYHFKRTDLRKVLAVIFKPMGIGYDVDPKMKSTVTGDFSSSMAFEQLLQAILRGGGATYRIEGGIYHFVPTPAAVTD